MEFSFLNISRSKIRQMEWRSVPLSHHTFTIFLSAKTKVE